MRKMLRTTSQRGGFTLVELCLGLVVTAMIASALAAFTLAVANCWRQTGQTATGPIMANQLSQRMYSKLYSAKRIGAWRAGSAGSPAGLVYWSADSNNDGLIQYSELAGIRYNPSAKTIEYFKPAPPGTTGILLDPMWTEAYFAATTSIDPFADGITGVPLLRRVASCSLSVESPYHASNAPVVRWTTEIIQDDGTTISTTGAVALRAAKLAS